MDPWTTITPLLGALAGKGKGKGRKRYWFIAKGGGKGAADTHACTRCCSNRMPSNEAGKAWQARADRIRTHSSPEGTTQGKGARAKSHQGLPVRVQKGQERPRGGDRARERGSAAGPGGGGGRPAPYLPPPAPTPWNFFSGGTNKRCFTKGGGRKKYKINKSKTIIKIKEHKSKQSKACKTNSNTN